MQRISIDPSSPKAGSTYKVCYDFSGLPSNVTSVTLHIYNAPPQPGDPQVVEVMRGSSGSVFCSTVSTLAGGVGQTIEDTSGNSNDYGVWLS